MTDQTLDDVVRPFLPATPTTDLATEPWIDVCDPGGTSPRQVGLREALVNADRHVLDDAVRGPLWRHATSRLLIALAYLVRAHTPRYVWDDVADGAEPLPVEAVDAVLDRLADHLWLHHPRTPFLQDLTVLGGMNAPALTRRDDETSWLVKGTDPFWTLLPDVPSKSNTAWFGRHQGRETPTAADAAAALLVRHYFALPGNEGRNRRAGGGRTEGGATGLTHNGRSFVTVSGPNLAATLARNLLDAWVRVTEPDTPTFFDAPDVPAHVSAPHPLWAYTASGAATVLVPAPKAPDGYRVIRTPIPAEKQFAKRLSALTAAGDPHGLRVDPKSKGQPYSHVSLSAEGSDLDLVRKVYGDLARSEVHAPSVIRRSSLAHVHPSVGLEIDVLVIDGAGGATGPRVGGTARFRPPTGTFDADPERVAWFLAMTNLLVGGKDAAATLAGTAALRVMAPGGNPPKSKLTAVYATARHDLAVATEATLRDLLRMATGSDDLPPSLPDGHARNAMDAAVQVFERLVSPFRERPAAVPLIVKQGHWLRSNLRRTLESS